MQSNIDRMCVHFFEWHLYANEFFPFLFLCSFNTHFSTKKLSV